MSGHLTKSLLALLCITSIACSTSNSDTLKATKTEIHTPQPHSEPIKITGPTIIKFIIPMGTSAAFQLLNNTRKNHKWDDVARIEFNDENCSTGHQASVSFKKNTTEHYTLYFQKESPWAQSNTLTISFGATKKQLIATLNNETIPIKTSKVISFLKITSDSNPINIQSIEHLPSE